MRVLIYGFTGNVLGGIEVYTLNMSEYMSDDCVFDYIVDGDECAYRERITKRGGKIFFVPWVRRHPLGYINKLWRIFGEVFDGTQFRKNSFEILWFCDVHKFPVVLRLYVWEGC